MKPTMKSLSEWIVEAGLTVKSITQVANNPNTESDPKRPMFHWRFVLSRKDSTQTFAGHFSTGSGWVVKNTFGTVPKKPNATDIFSCLISDAQSVQGATFEDWASDLGYDVDSRKAEKTYRSCQDEATNLQKFLGRELFNAALDCENDV